MDQDATWYGSRPQPRPYCVRRRPSSPPHKRDTAPSFRPVSIVATLAHVSYLGGRGAASPSNTTSPGPRPTSVPSGILIHPTVWLQYNVTGIQDRQDRQQTDSIERTVFGRPFVKRFALCYQTVVCHVCPCSVCPDLSVTLVYCGQTAGRIKMKLCMQVAGRPRPWPRCVTLRPSFRSPKWGLRFSDHIFCGQMAAWIKMPLSREVGLSPRDIVLDGDPAPPPGSPMAQSPPIFAPCSLWPNGWMD